MSQQKKPCGRILIRNTDFAKEEHERQKGTPCGLHSENCGSEFCGNGEIVQNKFRGNSDLWPFEFAGKQKNTLYFALDTGQFVTMVFWDKDFAENVIYQKLLADKLEANLGYMYENLVAQMLTASPQVIVSMAVSDTSNS